MSVLASAAIQASPPGTMAYAIVDLGDGPEVALLLREASDRIRALGDGPRVVIRSALIVQDGVGLIPLLAQVSARGTLATSEQTWESWVNVHAEGGAPALALLAAQPRIVLVLYGDHGRERQVAVPNALRREFRAMATGAAALEPWTMAEFDGERETVCAAYATPLDLWRALES